MSVRACLCVRDFPVPIRVSLRLFFFALHGVHGGTCIAGEGDNNKAKEQKKMMENPPLSARAVGNGASSCNKTDSDSNAVNSGVASKSKAKQ